MSRETRYAAFLIRWQDAGPQTRWRSTIENAYTGQKFHFSNKSDLLRFLWQSLYEVEALGPIEADRRDD